MNLCNGRSSDGSPLPKYEEIIGLIKSEVQSFGLSDVGLYLGDCFAGVRANSDSAMEKRLKTVEQAQEELKKRPAPAAQNATQNKKARPNNNGNGQPGNNNNRVSRSQDILAKKLRSICMLYNQGNKKCIVTNFWLLLVKLL